MGTYGALKYPKSILHEFYQVNGGTPTFVVDAVSPANKTEPRFRCTLTCPAVDNSSGGSFEEQVFTAEARKKKTSEHNAASLALDFLRERDMLLPDMQAAMGAPVAAAVAQGAGGVSPQDVKRAVESLFQKYC